MEVTKENFRALLPQIIGDIHSSEFISFDQEMSGIYKEEMSKVRKYETIEEWYLKNRRLTEGFVVIQFRMTCFFSALPVRHTINYRGYNFYIFSPNRSYFHGAGDAMAYLAENNFDFQKLFQSGIPFCDQQEEENLFDSLKRWENEVTRDTSFVAQKYKEIPVPEKLKEEVEEIKQQIQDFLSIDEATEVTLGPFNAYMKLFVYQLIETIFNDTVQSLNEGVGKDTIRLRKKNISLTNRERDEKRRKIEDQLGMRRLFQALANSKKILVGHNIFVPLMYIVRQFFYPLPNDYQEFKRIVHELFPRLMDTKHICEANQLMAQLFGNRSIVNQMIRTVHAAPFELPNFVPVGEQYGHQLNLNSLDIKTGSFRIGICFIGMVRLLDRNGQDSESFLNNIFVQSKPPHSIKATFGGSDLGQMRDVVFHATFPKTFDRFAFQDLFKDFAPVKVVFLSETTAILALSFRLSGILHTVRDPRQVHKDVQLKAYDEYVKEKWA